MDQELTLETERVDDIPLLLAHMERMGLPALIDRYFPTHGNWVGLDPGWVAAVWLASILSRGDHRLSHVQPWVAQRRYTPRAGHGGRDHRSRLGRPPLVGRLASLEPG